MSVDTVAVLTPYQMCFLRVGLDMEICETPYVGYPHDRTMNLLVARGYVTYHPTNFSAGVVRLTAAGRAIAEGGFEGRIVDAAS